MGKAAMQMTITSRVSELTPRHDGAGAANEAVAVTAEGPACRDRAGRR
jgi:hypothetical protein